MHMLYLLYAGSYLVDLLLIYNKMLPDIKNLKGGIMNKLTRQKLLENDKVCQEIIFKRIS